MSFDLRTFGEGLMQSMWNGLWSSAGHRYRYTFGKMWEYYANPIMDLHKGAPSTGLRAGNHSVEQKVNESGKCYVQAQEYGLPARITGLARCAEAGVYGGGR